MITESSRYSQQDKDAVRLKEQLNELLDGLIPIDEEELKLLANNPISKSFRKSGFRFSKGMLSTIYQEPLFSFAYKNYKSEKKSLLIVHSEKKQYKLLFDENFTKIFINNVEFGTIGSDDKLYSVDGRSVISEITKSADGSTSMIRTKAEVLAHLNQKIEGNTNNAERVFSLFHDFNGAISDEFIVLTLYYVLLKPKLKL